MKFRTSYISEALMISAVIGLAISYSSLYLFHVLMSLHMLLIFVNNTFQIPFPSKNQKMSYFLIFMLFWYALSIIWSINVEYSVRYLFYIGCGLYLVFVILDYINSVDRLKRFLTLMAIPFILELVVCLSEIATDFRMPVSPLSEMLETIGRDNSSRLFLVESTPTGFMWNPNDLAISMVILFPFFFFMKHKLLKVLGCGTIFFILLMTSSRGAFIALIFAVMAYPFLYKVRHVPIFIFGLLLTVFVLIQNLDYFENHSNIQIQEISQSFDMLENYLFNKSGENETSIGIRQKLIQNGLFALNETMYVGVGGGGSVMVQELVGGIGQHHVLSMHNFWLEVMVEAGILFGMAFIIWYIILLVRTYFLSLKTDDPTINYTSKALTLGMFGFLLGAVSSSSTIYFFPMWMMFGLSLAVLNVGEPLLEKK